MTDKLINITVRAGELLTKMLKALKPEMSLKVRWMKMLHAYMWIYGFYMVITAGIYMWRGTIDEPVWFNVGMERLFAAMWFGMYWLMTAFNNKRVEMYRELLDLDRDLDKSRDELIQLQREKIIELTSENNTLKAMQSAQNS